MIFQVESDEGYPVVVYQIRSDDDDIQSISTPVPAQKDFQTPNVEKQKQKISLLEKCRSAFPSRITHLAWFLFLKVDNIINTHHSKSYDKNYAV